MKKISFIIPVYNAEKYIERCLKNLIKYEGEDVEFIIINDGSNDSTHTTLKKYEKDDKRIINYFCLSFFFFIIWHNI